MGEWKVPEIWKDAECWILGGGPSVPYQFDVPEELIKDVVSGAVGPEYYSKYMEPIHDKHVIGINDAYRIGIWMDVIFFGDCGWWTRHRERLANWPGLKVSCCPRFSNRNKKQRDGIKYVAKDPNNPIGIDDNPRKVSWNNNSGAAAISLASHFGVSKIYLLGFDMSLGENDDAHWHPFNDSSPPFGRHLKGFSKIAEDAKEKGIEIINVSPESEIDVFPKVSLKEVIDD